MLVLDLVLVLVLVLVPVPAGTHAVLIARMCEALNRRVDFVVEN